MRILADTFRVRSPWKPAPTDHTKQGGIKNLPVKVDDSMHGVAPWAAKPGLSCLRGIAALQLHPCTP